MTDTWTAQDAKTRFGALLDAAIARGPQIVTRRRVEIVVVLSIDQWRNLERRARPNFKEWLLAPGARTERLTPARKKHRHRKPLKI